MRLNSTVTDHSCVRTVQPLVRRNGRSLPTPRVVAAIDVGTHAIGGGWAVISAANDDPAGRTIHLANQWEAQPDPTAKNLSAVLLDADDGMIAWGYQARLLWLTRGAELSTQGAHYHQGFKMDLGAQDEAAAPVVTVQDELCAETSSLLQESPRTDRVTLHLMTILLRQVVNATLEQIKASGYDEYDVRWTLTCPACFTDYQKSLLRDAGKNAGLPAEDGRVLLSLEPEAAAHFARVSGVHVVGDGNGSASDLLTPGARFMVVDCGGGTVDITAYQIDPDGKMVEIGKSLGDRFGSDFINRAFERDHLTECLGGQATLNNIKEKCPDALLNLIDQWERAKVSVKLDQDDDINLQIPAAIDRVMGAAGRRHLARRQPKKNTTNIVLTPVQIHALFDTVVPGTLDLIETQLQEMNATRGDNKNPDVILLVGGFSSSPYLQQAVRERFGDRAKVMVPPNPETAVLNGAVHFCYDPQVRARRSRFTYGANCHLPFKEGVDPEAKRYVSPLGNVTCRDRFSAFATTGESISTEAEVVHEYWPLSLDTDVLELRLYATRDPEPRYVTDDGCDELATITVDLASVQRFKDRRDRAVRLFMKFGETEIKVRAELVNGDHEVATQIRFHSNY